MRFVAASSADLRPIGDIVRSAQRSLAELGIDQWQDGYPSEEIIADDIASGEGYVILADDGTVCRNAGRVWHRCFSLVPRR